MSRDLFPTVKSEKHVLLKVSVDTMQAILEQSKREDRSITFIISGIVEEYYREKTDLKIIS